MEPDLTWVEHGLAFCDGNRDRGAFEEAIENLRAEWERDLRPPLPQFVLYQVEREQVEALLE